MSFEKYVQDFNKSDTIYSYMNATPFKPQKMERKMDNQLNIGHMNIVSFVSRRKKKNMYVVC